MDAELKAYLDAMRQDLMNHTAQVNEKTRQDLTQQIAESRQHTEQLNQETRQDLTQRIDGVRQDLTQRIETVDHQVRQTHVLIEDLRHDLQGIAEGVTTVRDQLGRSLDDHETRIARLERRLP